MPRSHSISPFVHPGTGEFSAPGDTRQGFECLVCRAVGYESYPGSDDFVDDLGGDFKEAQRTPNNGWVCSKSHLSQAMFEAASEKEKYSLQRVEIALCELEAHSTQLRGLLATWLPGKSHSALSLAADSFRESIAYYETTKWVSENEAREDVLEKALTRAIFDLQWEPVSKLSASIKAELKCAARPNEYRVGNDAWTLASIGNVILRLQEAGK